MRSWTAALVLSALPIGTANAADKCASNVLVRAFEGLHVNALLVSCMTQHNFSAALDGSVDLSAADATTAPAQVQAICASDACTTILSALVASATFNLTNCIVGDNVVLRTEISSLQTTCQTLSTPSSLTKALAAAPSAAPVEAPAAVPAVPTEPATPAPVVSTEDVQQEQPKGEEEPKPIAALNVRDGAKVGLESPSTYCDH
ncbi:unnamed protein product [Hyaloperonospora brassicae]|uniref:Elicitin-like protein n=1 Tax=Hyaloperonospora brassicae TaxID=162125 RepID=A0AAV0T2C5_HYABA|nr:unnamed protein product [Hyaloperonospora brassicae]